MNIQNWTPEARDALAMADLAAKLVAEAGLRRITMHFEKGTVKVVVEVRR